MVDRCNQEVFTKGHAAACLDACTFVAERFVQAVAKESGQRVDWHYSGGIANVLYLGDHAKVMDAIAKLASMLSEQNPRLRGECGSCSGSGADNRHRCATIIKTYPYEGAHGVYRHGDPLPDDVVAVDTH